MTEPNVALTVPLADTTLDQTGKTILQRRIEREQLVKLLTTGKTDLLEKFISKTGRPFSAWLVLGDGGKVGFEFPEREGETGESK